jgi:N-acetylmuramoyl-L-alanine amidase
VAGPSDGRNDTANAVQRMFVNDQPVEPDVNPQIIRGKLVVPVRFVARYLGARTDWDARRRRVTFTTAGRPSRTLMMTVGSTRAMDNAQARIMETAPVIRDGRLLVPLREVERFFRAQVIYNPRNRTVFVKTARDSTVPEGTAAGRPNAPTSTSPNRTGGGVGGSAPATLPPPNPRGGN